MDKKYTVSFNEIVIAVRYSLMKNELHMGCYGRFEDSLDDLYATFFVERGRPMSFEKRWTQVNKIRMVITDDALCAKFVRKLMDEMRDSGFAVERVKSTERIMR